MKSSFHLPLRLPGWAVACLLALFLFPGVTYRDLWKGDDAISIATGVTLIREGGWLQPRIGATVLGNPIYLYSWVSALTGRLFTWLVELPNAVRMASSLFAALMFWFIYLTRRELAPKQNNQNKNPSIATLILASCLGLALPVHLADAGVALLATIAMTLYGLAILPRVPWKGAFCAGFGIGLTALTLPAACWPLLLFALLLPGIFPQWRQSKLLVPALLALLVAVALMVVRGMVLPEGPSRLWNFSLQGWETARAFMALVTWAGWPALPAAALSLWIFRQQWRQIEILFPLLFLLVWALFLFVQNPFDNLLPMLLPLALLAAPGMEKATRGQSQSYNSFAMMLFTVLLLLLWLGWLAQLTGYPTGISDYLTRFAPRFDVPVRYGALILSIFLTICWLWIILTTPRSPTRGVVHWAVGVVICWVVVVSLWGPWFDYHKSYRWVITSMRDTMKSPAGCVLKQNVGLSQEASFYFYANIRPLPYSESSRCGWLLVQNELPVNHDIWQQVWLGRRPSDLQESYRLYRKKMPINDQNGGN